MQKGNIAVQTENIFPIIKRFLYSDHEIFLRELVSNAVDASNKLKALSRRGEAKGEIGELKIEILIDKDARTITIRDHGIGMTEEEVKRYLNQVAFSSAQEFLEKYKDETNIIGNFGLGFYSAFMVASTVEVQTRSWQEGSTGVRWICEGNPEYTLELIEKDTRGTDIILHVAEDSVEFLENERIGGLLEKYCKFLPIPIQFGTKDETIEEGEGEEKTERTIQVDNIINTPDPAWRKQPADLTDEDYRNFYHELYPHSYESPLFWIHLNIDYPFTLNGILYFPKLGNSLEVQRNKIQLYSNQVFVTDSVKEIVPEFLTLLHGVIDSPDIPLNVSRSYLQADSNVKKISGFITKKVADKLAELFNKDRADFESKWSDLGIFVKYGMLSDDKFYEKAVKFALVKNLEGQFLPIEEYVEKIKPTQTDKHDKVVIIYATQPDAQHTQIEACKAYGYDVVVMDQPMIDSPFMQQLEYKLGSVVFVRVDSDTASNLIQKDEKPELVLNEEEKTKVKDLFTGVVTDPGGRVEVQALSPQDAPVLITRPEFMRRMKEMQAMQGMSMDGFPDSFQVIVNGNHELVTKRILQETDETKRTATAKYLYQLALLNQGMLKGAELTEFTKRSLEQI
jgi:molecular chaperone HtpG